MKRLFDVWISLFLLIVAAPLLLVTAVLILIDLGSPVIFRQRRAGRDGQAFDIIKFRTMRDGDGSDAERVSRLGHWLRLTSIDELPELVNVLVGEMSLVGPRPHMIDDKHASKRERARLAVRPGMTGLAQVNGRNAISHDRKIALDLTYIRDRSLWLDLKILAKTLPVVCLRAGRDKAAGEALCSSQLWPTIPAIRLWPMVPLFRALRSSN